MLVKYGVVFKPRQIYNGDETGFMKEKSQQRYIGAKGKNILQSGVSLISTNTNKKYILNNYICIF